jgi:hypothetical protein
MQPFCCIIVWAQVAFYIFTSRGMVVSPLVSRGLSPDRQTRRVLGFRPYIRILDENIE